MKTAFLACMVTLTCLAFVSTGMAGDKEVLGAGATFPYPLYSKMFDAYAQQFSVKVNYQAIGSGGGIKQLLEKTVDFGGTDAFMTDDELKAAGAPIVHVPTCLGAVVLTYNLPGSPALKVAPEIAGDIFLGKITQWNDAKIAEANPGVALPDMAIVVIHRSDGSGTTAIFSDYLSKISAEWKEKVGAGKSLNWPAGLGAKGNPGVAGLVKQLPGAIGYVELIYTLQNKMPVAAVRNRAGIFVEPSIKSVSAAAAIEIPADTRVSITDTDAADGYPIAGFTWVILYQEQNYSGRSEKQARELLKLVSWMIHDGQRFAEELQHSPLPKDVVAKADKILVGVTYGGKPLMKK